MEAPARVAQQTFHQPTNHPTRQPPKCSRDCSGGVCVCVFSVKLLHPFISKSGTTRGGLRGAPGIVPVSWWWHHTRVPRGCSRGLAVASLEETRGLLSRFDCVYSDYITQGCAGGALAGCYEPTCQVLLFPYTLTRKAASKQQPSPTRRGGLVDLRSPAAAS